MIPVLKGLSQGTPCDPEKFKNVIVSCTLPQVGAYYPLKRGKKFFVEN